MSATSVAAFLLAAEEGGEEGGFWETAYPILPHPGELIVGTLFFVVLLWVVSKKVVPRLEQMYAERAAAIEGGIAKAEQAQAEANAALEEYQSQLTEARVEAGRIREEARAQGAQIIAEMRQQAQADAARISAATWPTFWASIPSTTITSLRAEGVVMRMPSGGSKVTSWL